MHTHAHHDQHVRKQSHADVLAAQHRQVAPPPVVGEALRSPGQPLPSATRASMEQRFGHDFSRVRVHTDAVSQQSARDLNSWAYTVGTDIVFGAGRFAPESREGRRLLTHELIHVVQQSSGAVALQRQPDPNAERAAAVEEGEAVAGVTVEQLLAQSDAEDALKLNSRRRTDKTYAWSLGLKDRARLRKSRELSAKLQQEIAVKMRFFGGEAKAAYVQTISPALTEFPSEQVMQVLSGPVETGAGGAQGAQGMACDIGQKQFPLYYEGEPSKTRCMDVTTDPEFANNYFDSNITTAVGYSVPGTTWENVEYGRFDIMLVNYKNGSAEYFILDEVGNFYYGGKTPIVLSYTYLKRKNGLVYPVYNGQIYFKEQLTPHIIAYKNGLKYQTKNLQDLYTLLQVAGVFASNLAAYGAVVDSFKISIQAFAQKPARLPGSPLPGRITKQSSSSGPTAEPESSGVPHSIADEADTQPMPAGGRVGEHVGDFLIAGDKALNGKTFERNIYGLFNTKGKTTDIRPVMQLTNDLIREAKAAGATELKITGRVIRNPNVLKMQRIVGLFGGTIRTTSATSVEIIIPLP